MPIWLPDSGTASAGFCAPFANPILPIDAPNVTSSVDAVTVASPRIKSRVSGAELAAPIEFDALSGPALAAPIAKTSVAASLTAAPIVKPSVAASLTAAPRSTARLSASVVSAPNVTPSASAAVTAAPRVVTPQAPAAQDPNSTVILYDNKLPGSAVAVTGGTGGTLTLSPNTFDRWNFTGSQTITFTLPANTSIDAIGVGAHNLSGRTITAEYSTTTGGSWLSFGSAAQTDNLPALLLRASVSARRIRVTVSGSGAGYIGVIYAGLKLQMPHPIYGGHTPLQFSATTDYFNNRSESGEWIGRQIRRRGFETEFSFDRLQPAWYRTFFQPFVESAKEDPFFIAWRPVTYPGEVGYCWTEADIKPTPAGGGRADYSVSFSVKAHG